MLLISSMDSAFVDLGFPTKSRLGDSQAQSAQMQNALWLLAEDCQFGHKQFSEMGQCGSGENDETPRPGSGGRWSETVVQIWQHYFDQIIAQAVAVTNAERRVF